MADGAASRAATTHDPASGLAGAAARRDVTTFRPVLLDAGSPDTAADLATLGADPGVVVVDELPAQLEQLIRVRAPRDELTGSRAREAVERVLDGRAAAAFGTWAFYPWSRRLVHLLPAPLHRELRFDRNRYAITPEEQRRLAALRVAVAGLSVGRAVVSTMAHEGIGGELRLADFDVLDLSNLNRVTGGVADIGTSKVVLAAREVAELDPYIRVVAFPRGVEETTVAEFVADVDVIVDECDDLEMKVRLREHARAARRPVVMATSHRGMLDVERFDRDPQRPLFHGLLGDVSSAQLGGLTTKQKVPYVIRILDPASLTDRAAASLVEVKETVSTWPQLASDVALGGAMVANVVRRIALGGFTASGRFYADLDDLTADGRQVPLRPRAASGVARAAAAPARMPPPAAGEASAEEIGFIVACASSAPSGGNMQPWRFEAESNVVRAYLDPARTTSLLDFRDRAALLALGAALEGAEIGARALGFEPTVSSPTSAGAVWELVLERSASVRDERAVDVLWQRGCNRRTGMSRAIPDHELVELARSGAPLETGVVAGEALAELGAALGALDRVRFLSPRLRRDLIGELRFTAEEARASRDGIDVAALELDGADLAAIEVLRTGAGMELLAELDRGWGLGNAARDAFAGSAGAIVLRAGGVAPPALVEAGRGLMRLWLEATRRDLAVHPWGSPFLFQHLLEDGDSLDAWERNALTHAATAFARVAPLDRARPILLILRISRSDPPSVRALRRPPADVLVFV
jgi:molybdopterin/thiamine biosynthesis adenylyltransferase